MWTCLGSIDCVNIVLIVRLIVRHLRVASIIRHTVSADFRSVFREWGEARNQHFEDQRQHLAQGSCSGLAGMSIPMSSRDIHVEYCLGFAHFRFCPNRPASRAGRPQWAASSPSAHWPQSTPRVPPEYPQSTPRVPSGWGCACLLASKLAKATRRSRRALGRSTQSCGQTGSARACHGPRRPPGHSVWPLLLSRSQCGHYLPSLAGLLNLRPSLSLRDLDSAPLPHTGSTHTQT